MVPETDAAPLDAAGEAAPVLDGASVAFAALESAGEEPDGRLQPTSSGIKRSARCTVSPFASATV